MTGSLEGGYLQYDKTKKKWMGYGKILGLGKDARFDGHG